MQSECILAIDPGIVNGAICIVNKHNIKDIKVWESFKLSYSGKATKKTIIKDLQKYTDNRLLPLIEKHNVTEIVIETQVARSSKLNGFEYFILGFCKGYNNINVIRIRPNDVCNTYDIPKTRKQKKQKTQELVHEELDMLEATYEKKLKEIEDKADAYMLIMVSEKLKSKPCKTKRKR